MTNGLVLNSETCDNIIKMMNSPDKENWTVVQELLNHIEIEPNLPYILILYKEAKGEIRKILFSDEMATRLINTCTTFSFFNKQQITYQQIYDEIKTKKVSEESLEYFLNIFALSLGKSLINWGYSFMEDFDIKLIPKK